MHPYLDLKISIWCPYRLPKLEVRNGFCHTDIVINKTMFWDPNKGAFDRFGGLMDPIDTPKLFKWLKIRFESSTTVLTNETTFGVAVGVTVLAVGVEDEVGYQRQKYFYWVVAHVHGFQVHVTWLPNSSIRVRYRGLYTEHDLAQVQGDLAFYKIVRDGPLSFILSLKMAAALWNLRRGGASELYAVICKKTGPLAYSEVHKKRLWEMKIKVKGGGSGLTPPRRCHSRPAYRRS